MESERIKALLQELVGVELKLVARRMECVNSRWDALVVAKNESKIEEDVSNALMVVSKEGTDASKRNWQSLGWN